MGFSQRNGPWRCLKRLYERTAVENLQHAKSLELARMDAIVQKIWPLLDNPRHRFKAAETLIAISQHRCKILGITESERVTMALSSRVDAEFESLTRQIAALDEPVDYPAIEGSQIELDVGTNGHHGG